MIRHNEIKIVAGSPFANCQLDRQQYSTVLTSIVSTYADGFVLAINNKWGTGKTTFVKMWEQDLKDKKYQTVYFNAWENDFENNPLTALMGELKTLTRTATEPEFKTVLKNAAVLSKNILPLVAKAIADRYVDTKGITEAIENITKGVTDIFENEVNEYAEKKKGITEFRKSLSKFIANTNEGKPLIFIVDELDRCRPDYAVAILEQIKHFFSVPNIVFVLSIDKEQLGNAVRGVYGSEQIDADEYLRRFIDVEYSIPEPEAEKYCKYLYNYFEFDEFFNSENRRRSRLGNDGEYFLRVAKILFKDTKISLRQQEKIFAHARLVLRAFPAENYVIPGVFLLLIFIKILNNSLYEKIRLKELSIKELQEEFIGIVKFNRINENDEREIMFLEAYLVHYYNNYKSPYYNRNKLYDKEDLNAKNKLLITSLTDKSPEHREFLGILENMSSRFDSGDLDIGYLLKKIDLTEAIKF
jgi:hypothetical protein